MERAPLSDGYGLLLIEDFCRSTGLERGTVEPLLRDGRIDGVVFDEREGVVGLVEDVLPTCDELRGMGLVVNNTYDPDQLRSHQDHYPDEDEDGTASPTWTMTWD